MTALFFLALFFLIGLYAPFFASSKPLVILWKKRLYFPLFRYLFFTGFYTKAIDVFFNLLMFTFPVLVVGGVLCSKKWRKPFFLLIAVLQITLFGWFVKGGVKDPSNNSSLQAERKRLLDERLIYHEDPLLSPLPIQVSWYFDLDFYTPYEKLNQLLDYRQIASQHKKLLPYRELYAEKSGKEMPTLWQVYRRNLETRESELKKELSESEEGYKEARDKLPELMQAYQLFSHSFIMAKYAFEHAAAEPEKKLAELHLEKIIGEAIPYRLPLINARHTVLKHQKLLAELSYLHDQQEWLEKESGQLKVLIPPFLRAFHWEEDAGGAQEANQHVPWWELTRINRKDLFASLLFGIRVSLVVGTLSILLALLIGIPFGMAAGYFAGKTDLLICRIIEMWEAMPTFFMLLLIVAITQSKSIFLVITVLGLFGWTGIARFIRSEVLRQRKLPYIDACRALGFTHTRIMFSHLLPNSIPPILTLLPFSMMTAITSEAGLSFLGLGEEGSASWGVLMDEGRSVFPAESYLLWPPAILLTLLLIAIALVGDKLRDAIDPKMR